MSETLAYLHVHTQDGLPTMVELPDSVSPKNKTEAALLSLGLSDTTTSVPRSMLVKLIEAEDGFLFPEVADRVQEQIKRALELQSEIAIIESQLANRLVAASLYMTEEDFDSEPWSYVEDLLYEWPTSRYDDRHWRELMILTSAEQRLAKEILQQEARYAELCKELKSIDIANKLAAIVITETTTIEPEEGVA